MSYGAYPAYGPLLTETGIAFPSIWPIERLRFSILSNPIRSEVAHWDDETVVSFVPMDAVGEQGEIDASQEKQLAEVYNGYTYFLDNDVLIAKITPCFENGKGAIAKGLKNGIGFGTTEFHVLRPLKEMSERWLFYLTKCDFFRKIGGSEMLGAGGQKRLPEEFIRNLRVGIPSFAEQEKIGNFLDWKTGQIDALIGTKQALIEKLKEKRLAVITQAVTKGLDPDIPMYDSKVSWLGKVPAGWTVKKLKYIATVRYGLGEPPEYVDEGLNLVRATDISKGNIATDGFKKVRAEDVPWERNPSLRAGEIVVVRSGAYTGDSAIVPKDLEGSIAGFDMVVTATEISSEILAWALLSPYLLEAQIYQTRMRAAQPHLNAEELGNFLVIVPAPSEQESIVLFIANETTRIDRLMDKTRLAIARLTEYRTALITAATTGQIDVRNVAIPAHA